VLQSNIILVVQKKGYTAMSLTDESSGFQANDVSEISLKMLNFNPFCVFFRLL